MVLQPAVLVCLFVDILSHLQDSCASAVINLGRCHVVQALVVAVVVMVINECTELAFQVARQEVNSGRTRFFIV